MESKEYFEKIMQDYNQNGKGRSLRKYCKDEAVDYVLDGKEGFLFAFIQGWWYRKMVDAKVLEVKRDCGTDKVKIKQYLKERYNINLNKQ